MRRNVCALRDCEGLIEFASDALRVSGEGPCHGYSGHWKLMRALPAYGEDVVFILLADDSLTATRDAMQPT